MDDVERAAVAKQYATAANLDMRISLHETFEVADRDW